ncbi:MAG: stage III sporulation protein AB [Clostridia bacterium]|jgi:stage III sporulation protein AB|nr:stage III sporulation protein AB [Clostridia bacterium]
MMKFIGAVLILLATTAMGILTGHRLAIRPQQLQKLRNDLTLLEMDINYTATPLPEALEKVAGYSQAPVQILWLETRAGLCNGKGTMAEEAWQQGLEAFARKAALKEIDLAVLRDFGSGLGLANREEQLKKFKLLQEQLRSLQLQAEEIRTKNERMWRTMGVLGGIALIILLY